MVTWTVLAGFSEGLGIISLIPVLEIFINESSSNRLPIANVVRELFAKIGMEPTLGILLMGVVLLAIVKAVFMWLTIRQLGYTIADITTDLRLRLLSVLMRAKWGYYIGLPSGHVSNAIGFESSKAAVAYQHFIVLFAGMVSVLIYIVVALFVAWWIVAIALFVGLGFMFLAKNLIRMSRDSGLRQVKVMKKLSGQLIDALHGIKAIKAMGREQQLWTLLEDETRALNQTQRQQIIAAGTLDVMREPVIIGTLSVVLFVILTFTSQPFAAVLVLAFLFNRVLTRVAALQKNYQSMVSAENAFWSVKTIIDAATEHAEKHEGESVIAKLEEELRFDHVSFKYGEHLVLDDVSFVIPAKKLAVVVGPSGAGKTTLTDLVLGLHLPELGTILIDGNPLTDLSIRTWRAMIGYVPQEMFLFHESIYKNVTLGDTTISREQCEDALRAAGALEFVSGLPEGMDTVVGERGSRLSGGQRQRIALARALVLKPNLLVLDEVTAGLDTNTEQEICKTLRDLRGSVTIIAVSHQPALLSASDLVIEVRSGRVKIADRATHSMVMDLG